MKQYRCYSIFSTGFREFSMARNAISFLEYLFERPRIFGKSVMKNWSILTKRVTLNFRDMGGHNDQ